MINNMLHAGAQGRIKHFLPLLGSASIVLGLQMVPISALKAIPEFLKFVSDTVEARLNSKVDRPDFISHIVRNNTVDRKDMSRIELDSNCVQFLIAGSETSGTALSGITFLLCKNPEYSQQLTKNIRALFLGHKEITFDAVEKIPLLNAVISEGLRIYPPVPTGFPRLVPRAEQLLATGYVLENVDFSPVFPHWYPQNLDNTVYWLWFADVGVYIPIRC